MKCVSFIKVDNNTPRYQHPHLNKELYIEKNGVSLVLNDDEIVQLLSSLGSISNDSFDLYKIEKGHPPSWNPSSLAELFK